LAQAATLNPLYALARSLSQCTHLPTSTELSSHRQCLEKSHISFLIQDGQGAKYRLPGACFIDSETGAFL